MPIGYFTTDNIKVETYNFKDYIGHLGHVLYATNSKWCYVFLARVEIKIFYIDDFHGKKKRLHIQIKDYILVSYVYTTLLK